MNRHTQWWRRLSLLGVAALLACRGGSSNSQPPPPPPPETFTITAIGGAGLDGYGGAGGYFDVENYAAGDAKVLRSGSVNTQVTLPTQLPYLGTNWQDVTEDTTLEIGTSGFRLGDSSTTVLNDDGPVTGMRVRPGVTLTIKPNYSRYSGGLYDTAEFYLDDGLIVEGTIKIDKRDDSTVGDGASANTADFLPLYVGGLWIAESGKIDVSGDDNASGTGANGAQFYSYPDFFFNAGVIDTSGGSGSDGGGYAGGIYVYGNAGGVINTGSLLSNGGAGGTGPGGDAYETYLETSSGYGYVISTGTISATGGDGATGGGTGGYTYLYTDYGDVLLSGVLQINGGDATDDGSGGKGGDLYGSVYGALRVAGTVDTHGGNGAGTGDGGAGGYFYFDLEPNESAGNWEYEANSQTIAIGANVDTSGGSGASGGDAGYFYLQNCNDSTSGPGGAPITLVGYQTIDLSGGNGTTDGGYAGSDNYLEAWGDWDEYDGYFAGSVVNEADWVLRGGNGGTGVGGDGAGIYMETEEYIYAPYDFGVTNSGALDGTGGTGGTSGGTGGYFYLYGKFFLKNTGAITASGGAGGTGSGGSSNEIYLYSEGPISAGALTSNGGASDSGTAAGGGDVYVQTSDVCTVSGDVTASGGDSASAAAGDGGYVWIQSQATPTIASGALTAAAGTGATGTPVAGDVWVDGMQISGP